MSSRRCSLHPTKAFAYKLMVAFLAIVLEKEIFATRGWFVCLSSRHGQNRYFRVYRPKRHTRAEWHFVYAHHSRSSSDCFFGFVSWGDVGMVNGILIEFALNIFDMLFAEPQFVHRWGNRNSVVLGYYYWYLSYIIRDIYIYYNYNRI